METPTAELTSVLRHVADGLEPRHKSEETHRQPTVNEVLAAQVRLLSHGNRFS